MENENKPSVIKEHFKSVSECFTGYMKNSVSAVDEAKKEKRVFPSIVFIIILYLCCSFLLGGHLRGLDYDLAGTESIFNDLGLLRYVRTFSFGVSFLLGFALFFVLLFVFVLTRFACVKIFSKGVKGSAVFRDSIIEFAMNSIPLFFMFLIGGVVSDLVWWLFYPIAFFAFMYLVAALARGIYDSVERKKHTPLLFFTFALMLLISLVLVLAVLFGILAYILVVIVLGIESNVQNFADNIKAVFDGIKSVFESIGNWFKNLFKG